MSITEKGPPEELVERVEATREELRSEARNRLGVTGGEEKPPPLREVRREHRLSLYPLAALGVLAIVDTFQGYGFRVLIPEVSATLGVSRLTVANVYVISFLASALGPLPMAALAQKARRALLIVVTAIVWSLVAISTGFVTAIGGLILVLVLDGLTTASVGALHIPFLMDSYPAQARVRAVSYYQGANSFGNVLAPLLVALFASSVVGFTWRGVFVALGLISLAGALSSIRLRDPGFGRWDSERIRDTVRKRETGAERLQQVGLSESDVTLGFFEIVRRITLVPTIRRLLVVQAVFGVFVVPYAVFQAFFLVERWNLSPTGRGLFVAFQATVAIASLALFARRGEGLYRRDPALVVRLTAWLVAGVMICIALAALSPNFAIMVALFGLSAGLLAPLGPSLAIAILSVIPSGTRPHASALIGIATAAGGFAGNLLLGTVDQQYGIVGAMVSLMIPGLIGALLLRSTAEFVLPDLDRMIDETLEDEEIRQIGASGGRLPMLACRKVDFSYDHVQVLFDVDFTVDDGEMVALLGTNGAGKSTLLKVISGIGLPSSGSVRYRGADITYLDAERRLRLGITQVPGGRAVFGPMNVIENLRVFGYSLGRNRKQVEEAIERSLVGFPALAERRGQKASTLSGGEQQMLGLAKALMLRPHLLLVDELSLGLAPVIVGQLFDMVREINREGTAVVLVEQSVNIALNLAGHTYFMEKGEIRFDGPSEELLRRDDLLRAVFLEGAPASAEDEQR
jgi:ABC-type branched-subunit amino acid transport system ATPase component/sugar phosphate permease